MIKTDYILMIPNCRNKENIENADIQKQSWLKNIELFFNLKYFHVIGDKELCKDKDICPQLFESTLNTLAGGTRRSSWRRPTTRWGSKSRGSTASRVSSRFSSFICYIATGKITLSSVQRNIDRREFIIINILSWPRSGAKATRGGVGLGGRHEERPAAPGK